jgi:hypothetical protein
MLSIMAPLPAAEERPRFRVLSDPEADDEDVEAVLWWSVEADWPPEAAVGLVAPAAALVAAAEAEAEADEDAFALCWA